MPQQLIYTSAPRGLVAGRSGHCTVARSAAMRDALMLQLEKLSYYQHLSLSGGQDRPIFAFRMIDIRGSRFHVLSRIQDAGLDFTGRTNFIAHHLVATPEEIRQLPTPPVIFRDWSGWVKSWTKDPQLLENEDWSSLKVLLGKAFVPAETWQRITGDAVSGYGLLEARAGASFRADDQPDETVLQLIAESMELLEVRDPRRDFRTTAWQYTFTTSMQEQDNPADFRWRCIHSDNPAASRFTPPDCRPLSSVRANKWTEEEVALARTGRHAPRFILEPQEIRITERETVRFTAKAEGVPDPTYQWFSVDRANNGQILPGETNSDLLVSNPALGVSRYVVSATNSMGNAQSEIAILSVEEKPKLQMKVDTASGIGAPSPQHVKSGTDIERQRKRLQLEQAQELFQRRLRRNKGLFVILVVGLVGAVCVFGLEKRFSKKAGDRPFLASNDERNKGADTSVVQPPANPAAEPARSNPTQLAVGKIGSDESTPKAERGVNSPPPTEFGLPAGWMRMIVGTVSDPNAEFVPPRFDLSGAAEGFRANGDSVLFACATNRAKAFRATLLERDPASVTGRYGIMIRESEKTNALFLFIGASQQRGFIYSRDNQGKFTSSEYEIPKNNQKKPIYFKFEEKENQIVPSHSFDSKEWIPSETYRISSNGHAFVGLAIYSGTSSNKVFAKFGGVDLSSHDQP